VKSFQLNWIIDKEHEGMYLREFLRKQQISKAALTDIKFHGGKIIVNGKEENVRYVLKKEDVVVVIFPKEKPSESMKPEKVPFEIVFEDEHCLVVNKPPYVSTIPSREHPSGSLANGLLYHFQQHGEERTVHIVNRLDRDTSGIMLVAKHRFSHSLFSKEQQKGTIKRTYIAIVHGVLKQDHGTIQAPISRKEDSIIERTVREDGQQAITHFRVLKRLQKCTFVELQLETGRTHQIRVHMAHIGHPLCGDALYGGEKTDINRQALHSYQIDFYHPFCKKTLSFTCPIPEDMKNVLNKHA
jgi:23S rRNA pseudouridine1911/1915/1917 synthase